MARNKEKVTEKKAELARLSLDFSQQYLNEEYNDLIEELINKMARKRDVPFITGRIEIWAAAVIHALGTINFLFDKDSQPYVSPTDIYQFFDTKQSTTSQKSKRIRDMFNMSYFDDAFSTNSVEQSNPFNNLTMKDGFLVPTDLIEKIEPTDVRLEDWEFEVAQILGVSKLEKGKRYSESDIVEQLKVTDESLIVFSTYLHKHLILPFSGTYEEEIDPLTIEQHKMKCIQFGQELEVDDIYGILMECRMEGKKAIIPLAEIEVDDEDSNFALIELYYEWFWSYR